MFESDNKVFDDVLPGPCRKSVRVGPCPILPNYVTLPPLFVNLVSPQVVQSPPNDNTSSGWSSQMVAFLVVGCVGCSSLFQVMAFFLYRHCNSKSRGSSVHDSGRLDDQESQAQACVLQKRLSHVIGMGNGSPLEEFSQETLLQVTNNFCEDHRIGIGSFGHAVYHATLKDGEEVAIERAEHGQVDKNNAFVNELESLSRLHHKNLVRLVGFCEDPKEPIFVYEYMDNGSLSYHLHKLQTSALMSWPVRHYCIMSRIEPVIEVWFGVRGVLWGQKCFRD